MSILEVKENLEKTIKKGGDKKIIEQLKRKLSTLNKDTVNK